jgi:hypothetical protein
MDERRLQPSVFRRYIKPFIYREIRVNLTCCAYNIHEAAEIFSDGKTKKDKEVVYLRLSPIILINNPFEKWVQLPMWGAQELMTYNRDLMTGTYCKYHEFISFVDKYREYYPTRRNAYERIILNKERPIPIEVPWANRIKKPLIRNKAVQDEHILEVRKQQREAQKNNEFYNYLKFKVRADRLEREQDFIDVILPKIRERGMEVIERSNGGYSINTPIIGWIDFYPKGGAVLVKETQKWVVNGVEWIDKNILK